MILAPYIINIFCGKSYEPAITNLVLISPIVLIIGLSSFISIQILYPQGREKVIIMCTILGTVVNVLLNIFLIKKYAHDGAAFSAVIGQLIILITLLFFSKNYHSLRFSKPIGAYIIATFLMIIIIYISLEITSIYYMKIPIAIIFGGIAYSSVLLIFKDPIFLSISNFLSKIVKR